MAKPVLMASEVKLNFKLRDFFLDLMACIVPGLIFLVAVSIIVGGLFLCTDPDLLKKISAIIEREFKKDTTSTLAYFLDSFSFNLYFFLLITFLAYFTGHLLYRQSPKRPDYASFLRIRERVMKKEAGPWVIEKGYGVKTSEVQFPYANLKNYLADRGFGYLAEHVKWDNEKDKREKAGEMPTGKVGEKAGQRSKTIINRAKIRLAFYFPEQMINLIRNEAHIRLASSMWYAAKFTTELTYICLFFLLLELNIACRMFPHFYAIYLPGSILLLLLCGLGKRAKLKAVRLMRGFEPDAALQENRGKFQRFLARPTRAAWIFLLRLWGKEPDPVDFVDEKNPESAKEARAKSVAKRIDNLWLFHDHVPLIIFGGLFALHYYGPIPHYIGPAPPVSPQDIAASSLAALAMTNRHLMMIYLGVVTFILIGVLFAKRRIEQTLHYQRVRELLYVLETAYIARLIGSSLPPNPLESEKMSYDIGLTINDPASPQHTAEEPQLT